MSMEENGKFKMAQEMLEMLEKLRNDLKKVHEEAEDEDPDSKEARESCTNDLVTIFQWAFGENTVGGTPLKLLNCWLRLHPELPVPRAFKFAEKRDEHQVAIGLLLDIYPIFLKEHPDWKKA